MGNTSNKPNRKSEENSHRPGDTSRTSSRGRKLSSGGGKSKKGNDETDKNQKARKI